MYMYTIYIRDTTARKKGKWTWAIREFMASGERVALLKAPPQSIDSMRAGINTAINSLGYRGMIGTMTDVDDDMYLVRKPFNKKS